MFRSLMTMIRDLYLTKVIFMLKHLVKLHHYIYLVMWQHHSAQHTTQMPLCDMLPHHLIYIYITT